MKTTCSASGDEMGAGGTQGSFTRTQWEKLDQIKGAGSTERQELYDFFIRRYWKPVYRFILCKGYGEQKTDELIEDFFAYCFRENAFAKADPARGRFRNFLLKSLQNFISNEERRADARKRKPPGGFVSIHDLATSESWPLQLAETQTPKDAFDYAWTHDLLLRALNRLEQDYKAKEQQAHFEIFLARIVHPALDGSEPLPFSVLAERYRLTAKQAANRLLPTRLAFQRCLRDEIALFASSEEEVTLELKDIFRFLSGS